MLKAVAFISEKAKAATALVWPARVEIACDGTALIGAGLVVAGVADVYAPAAKIIAGLALIAIAIIWTRRGA